MDDDDDDEIDIVVNVSEFDLDNLKQYKSGELEKMIIDLTKTINELEPTDEFVSIITKYMLPERTTPENYTLTYINGEEICIHKEFLNFL